MAYYGGGEQQGVQTFLLAEKGLTAGNIQLLPEI
jgi:hypothetical protein